MSTFVAEPVPSRCYTGEYPEGLLINHCERYQPRGAERGEFGANYATANLHHTIDGVQINMRESACLITPDRYEQIVLLVLTVHTGACGRNLAPRPQSFNGEEGAVRLQMSRTHTGNVSGTRCELVIIERGAAFTWDNGRYVFDGRVLENGRVEMTQRSPADAVRL